MELNKNNLYLELMKLKLPFISKFNTRLTKHETIKSQIHFLAFKFNLYPLPESKISLNNNQRINMLWIDYMRNPIVAIEINNLINYKSYKKIKESNAKFKIILSISKRKSRFKKSLKLIDPKEVIIVTPFL